MAVKLNSLGLKTAVKTANFAIRNVPAYRDFLQKKTGKKIISVSEKNFYSLPVMDKANYLHNYDLTEIVPSGKLPPMMHTSSGSSGKPTYWFRTYMQELGGARQTEHIFRYNFEIYPNDRTLLINCFSMGNWVAGTYMMEVGRILSRRGFNIATICPGIEQEDIINVLKYLPKFFSHVIILGYPPFLTNIFKITKDRKIKLEGKKLRILTSGDKFSEQWRTEMKKVYGIQKSTYIGSIYGSADVGIMATETPLSVWLRENMSSNSEIRNFFKVKSGEELPNLLQYDHSTIYFEEEKAELLITVSGGIPLVRYNIKDTGSISSFQEIKSFLKKKNLVLRISSLLTQNTYPFLALRGRSDVAILFYAINIFPQYIAGGLRSNDEIKKITTGAYTAYVADDTNKKRQELFVRVELLSGIEVSQKVKVDIVNALTKSLQANSSEYRKLYASYGKSVELKVDLFKFQDQKLFYIEHRAIVQIVGKKPRIHLGQS